MLSSITALVASIVTNLHVLCAAGGALSTWGVIRWSTFMGWYAKTEPAIAKATGLSLPAKLPTTVAELKAAAVAAAPAAPTIPADVEKALLKWKGDILADVKKI